MSQKRCPFCHDYISSKEFDAHYEEHLQLRPDGQHEDYVTLPPDERTKDSLDKEPDTYIHTKCNVATQMPEEIIRSYLVNPYLYLSDKTFCTGCGIHVPNKECYWMVTGEDLQSHMNRLRKQKPEYRPNLLIRILVLLIQHRWIK